MPSPPNPQPSSPHPSPPPSPPLGKVLREHRARSHIQQRQVRCELRAPHLLSGVLRPRLQGVSFGRKGIAPALVVRGPYVPLGNLYSPHIPLVTTLRWQQKTALFPRCHT